MAFTLKGLREVVVSSKVVQSRSRKDQKDQSIKAYRSTTCCQRPLLRVDDVMYRAKIMYAEQ